MPKVFGELHDEFMQSFIKRNSFEKISNGHTFVFSCNRENFLVPIYKRFRIDLYGREDFGVVAHLMKIQTQNEYILMSQEGMFLNCTPRFF